MSYKPPESFSPLKLQLRRGRVTSLEEADRMIGSLIDSLEKVNQHINNTSMKLNNNEEATQRAFGGQAQKTVVTNQAASEALVATSNTPVVSYAQAFQTTITTAPGVVTVTMPRAMQNATYQVPVARLISAAGSVSDATVLYPPNFNPLTGIEAVDSRTTTTFDVYVEENGVLICAPV